MTFGQRIELGRIITDKELTDIDKMKEGMQCLGVKWRLRNTSEIVESWYEVLPVSYTHLDVYKRQDRLKGIWTYFVIMFEHLGLSENRVKELWSLKYQGNLFRIKSKY